jgi:hypothetical protein
VTVDSSAGGGTRRWTRRDRGAFVAVPVVYGMSMTAARASRADGAALAVEAGAAGGGWGGRRGAERNSWESKTNAATSPANKQKAFAGRL